MKKISWLVFSLLLFAGCNQQKTSPPAQTAKADCVMMQAQAEKNYQKYDFPAPQRTSFFYSPKTGTCLYVFEYDTSVLSFGEVLFDAQNDTVLAHEFGKYDTDQEKDKKFKETVKSYQ